MRTIVKYFITFEFTSRQELHHEVEVGGVLEAVEHLDHPGVVHLHQDVPLRPHVGHLLLLHHLRLPQHLHRVHVASVDLRT